MFMKELLNVNVHLKYRFDYNCQRRKYVWRTSLGEMERTHYVGALHLLLSLRSSIHTPVHSSIHIPLHSYLLSQCVG